MGKIVIDDFAGAFANFGKGFGAFAAGTASLIASLKKRDAGSYVTVKDFVRFLETDLEIMRSSEQSFVLLKQTRDISLRADRVVNQLLVELRPLLDEAALERIKSVSNYGRTDS